MDSLAVFVKKIQEDEDYEHIRKMLRVCNEINKTKESLDEFERSKLEQWRISTTNCTPNEPIVLSDKNAEDFELYQNRKGTKKEIEYFKKAEKYDLEHS